MAIKKCVCDHAVQDKLHGKKMRVATPLKEGGHICTACGKKMQK